MGTILLDNIHTLATLDEERRVLRNGWILVRDHAIDRIGTAGEEPPAADRRIDLTDHVVLPGLINLHHHFFQTLLRCVPSLQDVSLFRWLHDMYLLMSEVRDEDQDLATRLSVAELLLTGCTTTVDHSYLKVNDMRMDTEIAAAREMGIRFHLARGSFSLGQKDGALPPDHIVEDPDDILADTERLIKTYHDPAPGAMLRIDNAPCSPFSVCDRVWVESIEMARKYGVGNHAHMAEAPDEERYMLATFGKRSVERAEELGWVGPDVWYAHATVLDDHEKEIIRRSGTGICNCPTSNMYTAANVCDVTPMLRQSGFKIGLGVDGSATNDSSHMIKEMRSAMMMQRAFFGADAMSATQVLELATLGGAAILRRDDLGVLAPGKMADLIAVDLTRLPLAGGMHDPLAALVFLEVDRVDLSIVNGEIRVWKGELLDVDLAALIREHDRHAVDMVRRAEKRYQISVSSRAWRRAYPYDAMAE